MLSELRETVCQMWDVANKLDEKGLAKRIPFIPEDTDLRHAMKAEIIFILMEICGTDKEPTKDQIAFLQYVLHAPIDKNNSKEFMRAIKSLDRVKFNPLMPYFALVDAAVGSSKLSEVYLNFMGAMSIGYMKAADSIDLDMMVRYYTIMNKNKAMIEKATETEIAYDPFDAVDDEKREMLENICKLHAKTSTKDPVFETVMQALEEAVKEKNGDSDTENDYGKFKKNIKDDDGLKDDDSSADNENVTDFDKNPKSSEQLKEELDSLIGLDEVKMQVASMVNVVKIREECKKRGIKRQDMSYHMVFSGNPGTGKTTVARLLAEIYHDMGLLSKGHLVEVSRKDLVAKYVGHTAVQVQDILKKAKGGVLFIDEAYSLASHSDNDFGHEAIETLIKGMEDNRDDMIVIVAGYPSLMQEFLDSNPGLSSRFSKTIYFTDYDADELTEIFKKFCKENNLKTSKAVIDAVHKYMESEVAVKNKNFGNARMVRNYFEQCMINQANRLSKKDKVSDAMLCNLTQEDIPIKFIIDKMSFFKL